MNEILDLTFIREMMGNDERLVEKFIAIFKTQCPRQLAELNLHVNNKDWVSLSNVAHGMATQFNYLNQKNLATQVKEIETITDEGDRDKLPDLIHAFELDVTKMLKALA